MSLSEDHSILKTESLFPTSFSQQALERIILGTRKACQKRVLLCGLVRDLEAILPMNLQRLQSMGEMFNDYQIVVYENDSKDRSLEILLDHARRDARLHVLSDSLGDPPNRPIRCLQRVERMARYRNRYREYIAEKFPDYDYVIVIDLDLPGGWDINGIFHSIGHDEWDFIGSYGLIRKRGVVRERILQYDAWAYREFGSFDPKTTFEVNHLRWERERGLVPVYSCFGGLGIYRMEVMQSCAYEGGDCEHIALHRQMIAQGMDRLFLNTLQTTDYGYRDSRLLRILNRSRSTAARMFQGHEEVSGPAGRWNLALHPLAVEEQVAFRKI